MKEKDKEKEKSYPVKEAAGYSYANVTQITLYTKQPNSSISYLNDLDKKIRSYTPCMACGNWGNIVLFYTKNKFSRDFIPENLILIWPFN